MPEYLTIMISLASAATSIATAVFTWRKFRFDKRSWIIEIKKAYSSEICKARLETYPILLSYIEEVSTLNHNKLILPNIELAEKLNAWLYGKGGLVAESKLRNCILHLRDELTKDEGSLERVVRWKHATIFFLRYDLDIYGLEDSKSDYETGLLATIMKRVETSMVASRSIENPAVGRYGDPKWSPSAEMSAEFKTPTLEGDRAEK